MMRRPGGENLPGVFCFRLTALLRAELSSYMQLAILHYHLNRGGVTQAIMNHLESLASCAKKDRPEKVALVHCGRREGWPAGDWQSVLPFECVLVDVPPLEYDAAVTADPEGLADAISHALLEAGFDLPQTVLHTHNHSLGKNASLPGALGRLASRGLHVLMQVHDFAEDFRPANYRHMMKALKINESTDLAALLYPQSATIHYATLTGRDHNLLAMAGVAADRLHVLPNPVAEFDGLPDPAKTRPRVRDQLDIGDQTPLVIYPVRGIRRKNVGEVLLYSALSGSESCYAITLAPENPAELASFDRWHSLADRLELNCKFGIGNGAGNNYQIEFVDALSACDAVITTSVAEGFGMVFLETWLAGRPLIGRNLPEITGDFLDSGLEYPGLRDELLVPVAWLDEQQLRDHMLEIHSWACRDYNARPAADCGDQLERLLQPGSIDFARLPTLCQTEIIGYVAAHGDEAREEMWALNPGLQQALQLEPADQALIEANAERVREAYSPEAIGERLCAIYSRLLEAEPCGTVESPSNGTAILDHFLRLDRMMPIRIE